MSGTSPVLLNTGLVPDNNFSLFFSLIQFFSETWVCTDVGHGIAGTSRAHTGWVMSRTVQYLKLKTLLYSHMYSGYVNYPSVVAFCASSILSF